MRLINPYNLDHITGQPLNLPERIFTAKANEIIDIEFKRLRPLELVKDIKDLFKNDVQLWNAKKTYAVNDFALFDQKLWKAKQINLNVEPSEGLDWQQVELYSFYIDYCLKWLAEEVYIALLIEQGVNITPFSVVQPIDSTYANSSQQDKTRVIQRRKSIIESYFKEMELRLKSVNFTFDGKKYEEKKCQDSSLSRRFYSVGGNVENINEY